MRFLLVVLAVTAMIVLTTGGIAFGQVQSTTTESEKGKHPNMDSRLAYLYEESLANTAPDGSAVPSSTDGQTVQVVLELTGKDVPVPQGLGIIVEVRYENLVQATIPVTNLDAIASDESVVTIRLPLHPVANEVPQGVQGSDSTSFTVSEGVGAMGADVLNDAGYTGKNVKVAVIDTGFNPHNPEIAGNIAEMRSFDHYFGIAGFNTLHGTAVAEVIVDIAPDAELYLYNFNTDIEFLNLIDHIIDRGDIDIISMSLGWYNDAGLADGTSILSQKVDDAKDSGILFVISAGNEAKQHWQGTFSDPDKNDFHNFQGDDEGIPIDVSAFKFLTVYLSWWDTPSEDYDLFLYDADGTILESSRNIQPDFPPFEVIVFPSDDDMTVYVKINGEYAENPVDFQLYTTSYALNEYGVSESSLSIPADAEGSFSVGAVNWEDNVLEDYSSHGPTLDGRIKPDITGPSVVSTTAYGELPFNGTSAAAPHVAGAAALVMEKYPNATVDEVRAILEATVNDRHTKTNQDGVGRVDVSMLANSDILALDNNERSCDPCFYPEIFFAEVNDIVTWVNADNSAIGVTGDSNTGRFTSGNLQRGETHSETFTQEGIFDYSDVRHTWASGIVEVGPVTTVEPKQSLEERVASLEVLISNLERAITELTSRMAVVETGIPPVDEDATGLAGTVFTDTNNNGVLDSGESGVAGQTVIVINRAYVADVNTVVTDSDGKYSFDLDTGGYLVQVVGVASDTGYANVTILDGTVLEQNLGITQ